MLSLEHRREGVMRAHAPPSTSVTARDRGGGGGGAGDGVWGGAGWLDFGACALHSPRPGGDGLQGRESSAKRPVRT